MKTLLKRRRSRRQKGRVAASRRVLGRAAVLLLAVFVAGLSPAGATATLDTVRDVRFGDHIRYERAVIDLGTRREAGEVAPSYRSYYKDGDWVVRVDLPTARHTLTSGGTGLGRAISRYHVVRTQGGSLSVYFHLTGAASRVNVFRLNHPARVVVDISRGGTAVYARPTIGANTVILTPRAGRSVGPRMFMVKGYGRPFEGRGAWRVVDASGKALTPQVIGRRLGEHLLLASLTRKGWPGLKARLKLASTRPRTATSRALRFF